MSSGNSIISTRNVWPYYDSTNIKAAGKASTESSTLGKDDFLKILVTQLRNQDPMQPMQDRDFIAQMAQFSSVEQLMNMSKEMTALRQNLGTASSLIGKQIEWFEYDSNGTLMTKKGIVESIGVSDGVQYAQSGGSKIPMEFVTSISEPKEDAGNV
ncbi:flagellar hook assembly protein FlgD [Paenibacillus sambharensis]|nr:flagellar hook assembly protein FlgD [Paenibacillus sambharensis]